MRTGQCRSCMECWISLIRRMWIRRGCPSPSGPFSSSTQRNRSVLLSPIPPLRAATSPKSCVSLTLSSSATNTVSPPLPTGTFLIPRLEKSRRG
nr:hypothetical protein I308_06537 [Cryptococcus tetragattii IND107]